MEMDLKILCITIMKLKKLYIMETLFKRKNTGDIISLIVTVKIGENKIIGDIENKIFSKASFRLYDNIALKEYELNDSIGKITAS